MMRELRIHIQGATVRLKNRDKTEEMIENVHGARRLRLGGHKRLLKKMLMACDISRSVKWFYEKTPRRIVLL